MPGLRTLSLESLEPRCLLAVTINIGHFGLLPDTPGQTVELRAESTGLADPHVSGFNLRAQIGDGLGGSPEPVFEAVDFAGGGQDVFGAFDVASHHNSIGIVGGSTGLGDDPDSLGGTLSNPTAGEPGTLAGLRRPNAHPPAEFDQRRDRCGGERRSDRLGRPTVADRSAGARFGPRRGQCGRYGSRRVQRAPGDNTPPEIGSVSLSVDTVDTVDTVTVGDPLTITALGVQDDHGVASVSFYRDTNRDGGADPVELIGTDADGKPILPSTRSSLAT